MNLLWSLVCGCQSSELALAMLSAAMRQPPIGGRHTVIVFISVSYSVAKVHCYTCSFIISRYISQQKQKSRPTWPTFSRVFNFSNHYTKNATITSATMFKILIIGLIAGPAVSLYGSPTVSPVTAALWASEPLPPWAPPSICFLALSQAPPPDVIEMATKRPVTIE